MAVNEKLKRSCDFAEPFYDNVELDTIVVDEIVRDHLRKQGYKDTLAAMASEQTGLPVDTVKTQVDLFEQLDEIMKQLAECKTETALCWAKDHKFEVGKESDILFLLHQINMRDMLAKAVDLLYNIKYQHQEEDQEMPEDESGAKKEEKPKVPDMQAYNELLV